MTIPSAPRRRQATIYAGRPISAPAVAKPQHARLLADADTTRPRAEGDTIHIRCRGAKSFVDDLGQSRGVVLSRAVHFCDLLRLSPTTRRFVRFRRTRLPPSFFPLLHACVRVELYGTLKFLPFGCVRVEFWTLKIFSTNEMDEPARAVNALKSQDLKAFATHASQRHARLQHGNVCGSNFPKIDSETWRG